MIVLPASPMKPPADSSDTDIVPAVLQFEIVINLVATHSMVEVSSTYPTRPPA